MNNEYLCELTLSDARNSQQMFWMKKKSKEFDFLCYIFQPKTIAASCLHVTWC